MLKLKHFLPMFAIATMIGCSEDPESPVYELPTITGNEIVQNDLKSGSGTLVDSTSSVSISFAATTGKSYAIKIDRDTKDNYFEVGTIITNAQGDTVASDTYNGCGFVCTATGTYTITVSLSYQSDSESGPYAFTYDIVEMPSTNGAMDGKWYLSQTMAAAFGKTKTENYSKDKVESYFEIRNDSVFNYYYDTYGDSVESSASPLVESEITAFKYEVSNNNLTFSWGNSEGVASYTFSRFDGDVNDITWARENFTVPDAMIGTWYLASEIENEVEIYEGERDEWNESNNYPSADLSTKIIVITKDSITTLNNDFGNNDSPWTSSVKERSWFFRDLEMDGNDLICEELEVWVEDNETEMWYELERYKKYTGELPPAEWAKVQLPTSASALTIDTKYTSTAEDYDTLWFEITLEKGSFYNMDYDYNDNYSYSSYIVNADTREAQYFHGFEAPSTGTYYIAVIPYSYTSVTTVPVEFTVTKYDYNYGRSAVKEVSAKQSTEKKEDKRSKRKAFPFI